MISQDTKRLIKQTLKVFNECSSDVMNGKK